MYLQNIKLRNFRNYAQLSLQFSPQTNIFIGQNAQGKTNLLEAIYVVALVRSHRTSNNQELISWGSDFSKLEAHVQRATTHLTLELILSLAGKKASLNHIEQKKLSSYIGKLNVVLFAPEDLNLIKGAPSIRRRFIDMELGQIDQAYLTNSSRYRQVLRQRNNYLKQLQKKQAHDQVYLDVISDQLAGYGAAVIAARQSFLNKIQQFLQPIHRDITGNQEQITLEYQAPVEDAAVAIDTLYQQLLTKLNQQKQHDIFAGSTSVGPHRDDFRFLVNDNDLQKFGSQGQQRTAVLSLKLAELDLFKGAVGDYPILLLDDVLSELDQFRQTHLLQTIQNRIQTFITTTSLENVDLSVIETPKIFKIKAGGIL
ncbi:DNA replication/repair protein RecF [Bombilactobacillus bombi]|uniref:DNA replication and repair protein RecF n=1 Tax=Bombilactobacillus bombi TaxID=1303590 RepID=A0A3R6YU87_9LACO|nr:DNA replication/repair protein RecF [Bombilactobacillus bombi]RHW52264.1 DNA replication/repair protein RecF [Bombilactobacillus bombi]